MPTRACVYVCVRAQVEIHTVRLRCPFPFNYSRNCGTINTPGHHDNTDKISITLSSLLLRMGTWPMCSVHKRIKNQNKISYQQKQTHRRLQTSSKLAPDVTLLTYIREVGGSFLGRATDYPDEVSSCFL